MSFKKSNTIRAADDAVSSADRNCSITSASGGGLDGGAITLTSGWSDPADVPGDINLETGAADSGTFFDSGSISIRTGGGGFDGYSLGSISIRTGGGNNSPHVTETGSITLGTGQGDSAENVQTTGDINITTGAQGSAVNAFDQSGTITLSTGASSQTTATKSGDIVLQTGANGSAASAVSGEILLETGAGQGGTGTGPIRLVTGNGGTSASGDIELTTGNGTLGDVGDVVVTFGGRGSGTVGRMYSVSPQTFGAVANAELIQAIGYAEVQ